MTSKVFKAQRLKLWCSLRYGTAMEHKGLLNRRISRYRRHYGSKVNRTKTRQQDVIAFVNTSRQIYLSWQLCVYRHLRKFSWICWLIGKKMIYCYIFPVDLENNKRSCNYSKYSSKDTIMTIGITDNLASSTMFTKHHRIARINKYIILAGTYQLSWRKFI
jgi:hypothetical protein